MTERLAGAGKGPRVLVPVDGSANCLFAVRHVIKLFMNNTAMEIHLLSVQRPFSRHIARFFSGGSRRGFHRNQAESALASARQMLQAYGIPLFGDAELGDKAGIIARTARRHHCDRIVLSVARTFSLTKLADDAVARRIVELAAVPVEVVAGDAVSGWNATAFRSDLPPAWRWRRLPSTEATARIAPCV